MLDYAWQFFQRPIWYPNRYSFVFSFLLITTAYKSFNLKNSIKINNFVTIIVSLLLLALIVNAAIYSKIIDEDISKIILLILSCICVIEYMISFNLKKLSILIALIFILEVSANTVVGVKQISFAKTEPSYSILNKELSKSFDYIEETDPIQNNFYRMDSSNWTNINNGGSFNYNSLIYFNSLRNGKMMYFLEHYADYTVQDGCSTRFNAKNPIFTSLLGFKYIVSNKEEFYYDKIYEAPYSIYKIEENLSLGFMMNSKIKDLKLEDNKSYENSINIIDYSTNIVSNALTNLDYNELIKYWIMEEGDGTFVYYNSQEGGYVSYRGVIEKDAFVFLNPSMKGRNQYNLILNDEEEIKSFDTKNFTPLLLKKGDKYEIKLYFSSSREKVEDLKLYFLDYSSYINWVNEMKENGLEILKYEKDNYIKGKVMVNEDKTTLFTSIPYDKGWRISVDGKNVSYNLLMDAFIGIDLTKGEHIIEFKYIPRGFIWGSIISILSLGTTIIYLKKRKV